MLPERCFFLIKDQWYVLMNWRARSRPTDAVLLQALSSDEIETYFALQRAGHDDADIFNHMYPPQYVHDIERDVPIPMHLLTKAQLAYVIEHKLSQPLPSLTRMRRDDLQSLYESLKG